MKIDIYTEPVADYQKGIDKATNRVELINHIREYKLIAFDAYKAATRMSDDWQEFQDGLAKERKKEPAGEEWQEKYADILLPRVMFEATVVAVEFMVPWGLAYQRLIDVGFIKVNRGIAIWKGPDAT